MDSLDYSDYNESAIQEFPYWQPLIAIDIIIHFEVMLPLAKNLFASLASDYFYQCSVHSFCNPVLLGSLWHCELTTHSFFLEV